MTKSPQGSQTRARAPGSRDLVAIHVASVTGFTRLVAAFYRLAAQDDLLRLMYPAQDLSGTDQRLRKELQQLLKCFGVRRR